MTNETIRSVDIGHMRNDYADIAILRALRDVLDARDDWTIYDEGEWEEYAREGGAYYAPDIDPYDDELAFWDRQDATSDYILELEGRLALFFGILCRADGESGMYWIERGAMRRKAIVGAVALLALGACSGTVDRHDADVQAAYLDAAHDAVPDTRALDDELILEYGLAICEALDAGVSHLELAIAVGFTVQDSDIAGMMGALSAYATIQLCPEHLEGDWE